MTIEIQRDLSELSEYMLVKEDKFGVSSLPLVSWDYYFCKGLVMMNGNKAGLAHIFPWSEQLDDHTKNLINKLIEEMECDPKELKAMVIGVEGLDGIIDYCQSNQIKVVEVFRDKYLKKKHIKCHPRDILVRPSLKEVWIYTHKGKVTKRFEE